MCRFKHEKWLNYGFDKIMFADRGKASGHIK